MFREKRSVKWVGRLLTAVYELDRDFGWILFPRPTMNYALNREYIDGEEFSKRMWQLKKSGWLDYEYKEAKLIVKLTKKGQMDALLTMSLSSKRIKERDGKWWIIMFDIPEHARDIRNKLRKLLKQYGFKPIQASVYITPYQINDRALEYLNKSKLIRYIRIARIDKLDNSKDLIKHFRLK